MRTAFIVALQVSIFLVVFSFGLAAGRDAVRELVRRPSLLGRSLLAMFVIMPVFVVVVLRVATLRPPVEAALLALALSPVPPLLPQRELAARGTASYAFGLLFTAALVALAVVPLGLWVLSPMLGVALPVTLEPVLAPLLLTVLVPFAAGMALRHYQPSLAARIRRPLGKVGLAVLLLGVIVILVKVAPLMGELIGNGTLLVFIGFTVVGLVAGHLLGGPEPADRTVLALSTGVRHPAVALAIATMAFEDVQGVAAAIVLYLLVNVAVSVPYLVLRRRAGTRTPTPTPQKAG